MGAGAGLSAATADWVGVGEGDGECDGAGGGERIVGPPPGEIVGVAPAEPEPLGVGVLGDAGGSVALPCEVPTFAGGGNASTG